MDLIQMKKIHHLYFYFLTVLSCSVFYCITSCFSYLSSLVKVVFFVLIPGFASVLLSSKILFIISILIILAIVVDSRIFFPHDYYSSSTTHVYLYEDYVNSNQTQWPQISTSHFKISKKEEKNVAEKVKKKKMMKMKEREEQSVVSASDELNKRADAFIERVLRQRRLELNHLKPDSFSLEYS
ncbi:hypothetical protein K1719_038567 [Acacia pycnantha]|nr:hypothetical protein K1719_038567 [Acacia pycnantha]